MRTIIAFILAAVFAGTAWAAQPTGVGHEEDIARSLSRLEKRASTTKQDAAENAEAVKLLKQHPQDSVVSIVAILRDKKKNAMYRDECLRMLSQKEFLPHVQSPHYEQIIGLVDDARETPLLRIHAARLILRQHKAMPEPMRKGIKKMAFELIEAKKSSGLVYNLVLSQFAGDPDVEKVLLDKLQSDANKNSAILALGKIKSSRGLEEIVKLLDSGQAGKSFVRVRAYLAIGDIGGEKAFDVLQQQLDKEKNDLDRDSLISAIARTKTARGRDFLVRRLQKATGDILVVLNAIRYSGDTSIVPILEQEMAKPTNARHKAYFERAIDALRKGDDSTPW